MFGGHHSITEIWNSRVCHIFRTELSCCTSPLSGEMEHPGLETSPSVDCQHQSLLSPSSPSAVTVITFDCEISTAAAVEISQPKAITGLNSARGSSIESIFYLESTRHIYWGVRDFFESSSERKGPIYRLLPVRGIHKQERPCRPAHPNNGWSLPIRRPCIVQAGNSILFECRETHIPFKFRDLKNKCAYKNGCSIYQICTRAKRNCISQIQSKLP